MHRHTTEYSQATTPATAKIPFTIDRCPCAQLARHGVLPQSRRTLRPNSVLICCNSITPSTWGSSRLNVSTCTSQLLVHPAAW